MGWRRTASDLARQDGVGSRGTLILTLAWLIKVLVAGPGAALPADWWYYLGGPLGCLFVVLGATLVRCIGVLVLGLGIIYRRSCRGGSRRRSGARRRGRDHRRRPCRKSDMVFTTSQKWSYRTGGWRAHRARSRTRRPGQVMRIGRSAGSLALSRSPKASTGGVDVVQPVGTTPRGIRSPAVDHQGI